MPGQFAHLLLVDSICKSYLDDVQNLEPSVRSALANYRPFCRLGAVSPDCPMLVRSTDATGWNSVMHYVRPADFVRYGIERVLQMPFNKAETRQCLAWLFGYAAHVVADYTIHPVVMALVGPYSVKKNRPAHARCELDQDSYLYHSLTGQEIATVDFLKFTGFRDCGVNSSTQKLSKVIVDFWAGCLSKYSPEEVRKVGVKLPRESLTPSVWFATYVNIMKNFAVKGGPITKFLGMDYRASDQIDKRFVENLSVPNSTTLWSYDRLFEVARDNIVNTWSEIAGALKNGSVGLCRLANADLDTGKREDGTYVFWP